MHMKAGQQWPAFSFPFPASTDRSSAGFALALDLFI